MLTASQNLELVGLIYEAAADASVWPVFLERLAEAIDADGTVLFAIEPEAPWRSVSALTRFDPGLIQRYIDEFADNIWVQRADARFAAHEVRYSQGLATARELNRDRYHADFLSPAHVEYSMGLKIPFGSSLPGYLATSRSSRKAAFDEHEGHAFLTLAPHIQRALDLHRRVASNLAFHELLDRLPQGVVFADERGCPLWWNQYAEEIFRTRDGLWVDAARLRTARLQDGEALHLLIRQASRLGTNGRRATSIPSGGAMAISRPSLRRAYALLVSPIGKNSSSVQRAAAVVLITDPERSLSGDAAARFESQFGLTPAEARVAAILVQGKPAERVAEELSISSATVRTHIRNLLEKTATARQSDLMRVLLSGPSLRDGD